jgi:hypothetical protein
MDQDRQWRVCFKRPIMFGTKRFGVDRDEVIVGITMRFDPSLDAADELSKIDYDSIDWEQSDPMTREEFAACCHAEAISEAYEEASARADHYCEQVAEHGEMATHRWRMAYLRMHCTFEDEAPVSDREIVERLGDEFEEAAND